MSETLTHSEKSFGILFVYHFNWNICKERILLLRLLNPGVPIYGLYGGPDEDLPQTEEIAALLDDHWCYPNNPSLSNESNADWKWLNVDIMICRWHEARGNTLPWGFIVVHPWDTLYLEPIKTYVDELKHPKQTMIYPQVRDTATLKAIDWVWTNSETFSRFEAYMNEYFPQSVQTIGTPMFIVILPRAVLHDIAGPLQKAPGMCEYRFPTLAKQFGADIVSTAQLPPIEASAELKKFVWPDSTNPDKEEIKIETILEAFDRSPSIRLFHPVYHFGTYHFDPRFQLSESGEVQRIQVLQP